jgi:hypothetical protein
MQSKFSVYCVFAWILTAFFALEFAGQFNSSCVIEGFWSFAGENVFVWDHDGNLSLAWSKTILAVYG